MGLRYFGTDGIRGPDQGDFLTERWFAHLV